MILSLIGEHFAKMGTDRNFMSFNLILFHFINHRKLKMFSIIFNFYFSLLLIRYLCIGKKNQLFELLNNFFFFNSILLLSITKKCSLVYYCLASFLLQPLYPVLLCTPRSASSTFTTSCLLIFTSCLLIISLSSSYH